jgi:hypothetical protein
VASEDASGDVDVDVASVGKCDGVQEVEVLGTNSSGSEGEGDGGGRNGGSSFVCTDVRGEDESPSCAMKTYRDVRQIGGNFQPRPQAVNYPDTVQRLSHPQIAAGMVLKIFFRG